MYIIKYFSAFYSSDEEPWLSRNFGYYFNKSVEYIQVVPSPWIGETPLLFFYLYCFQLFCDVRNAESNYRYMYILGRDKTGVSKPL